MPTVFSAADLIDALLHRRRLKSIRPETPGQLPAGWQAWLDAMPARRGAVTGVPAQALVEVLLPRSPKARPARTPQLNRWQAFATLWRQQWQPPPRELRGQHWFAVAASGLLHLCFAFLLLWIAYVQLLAVPPASGGDVVQVEFIGRGTPEEEGGGAPGGEEPEPEQAEPAAAARPSEQQPEPPRPAEPEPAPPQPEQVATEPPAPSPAAAPEVAPPQPSPPAAQPVQVTEVAVPDTPYVLPPATPRVPDLAQPQVKVPELQTQPETLVVEVPRATAPVRQPELAQPAVTVPELREQATSIQVPQRMAQARALEPQPTAAPSIRVPQLETEPGRLQVRQRGTATTGSEPGTERAATTSAGEGRDAAATGGPPIASRGIRPGATASGSGAAPTPRPGAWPTVPKGDDWGASNRNQPGGAPAGSGQRPGLFNADGSPRLVDAPAPDRNAPGTVEQNVADLDRAGTWLKRPPYDYQPTMFDRFWVPHETLLQEWVRKGIKAVSIPIPGTDKRLMCVVSMLQFGGGCGLVDPNVNEQPATARPPPDIPFKPHLQEDNGSVPPPAGGAQ